MFKNACIYTVDRSRFIAPAMVIRDGDIVYIGKNKEVDKYIGPQARAKLLGAVGIDLFSWKSVDEYRSAMEKYIRENAGQQVIVGAGRCPHVLGSGVTHRGFRVLGKNPLVSKRYMSRIVSNNDVVHVPLTIESSRSLRRLFLVVKSRS